MKNFVCYLPVQIVFGCGRVAEAGVLTAPYGKKALIVTGRSSAKKSGLYDRVKNSLAEAGVDSVLFDQVSQNPLTTTVEEGARLATEQGCDVVVAIGGMVINTAGVTLAHGMEHPASGLKDIVHGQGLAALTPAVIEASYPGAPEKFARISKLLGGQDATDCAARVQALLQKLNLTCTLGDLGLTEADIPWMAENCMKVSAASVTNNPVVFTQEQIADIYRKAL